MEAKMGDILFNQEARQFISKLKIIDIQDYASSLWFTQDQHLQKLNMQAHINALMHSSQFIMEQCVSLDKIKTIIYDLIVSQTWKQQVLPLIKQKISQLNSFRAYIVIYHESVVLNLLQCMMYHRTAVEQAQQYLIELIDYCYRKLMKQLSRLIKNQKSKQIEKIQNKEEQIKKIINSTPLEQLIKQQKEIQFGITMMSISIIRYITDHIKNLQIGILHLLIVQCDIICILVPLIQMKPWLRTNTKGQREIYQNSKWILVKKQDYHKLPKIQAQVWIALFNLYMDVDCRKKYQLNQMRKNNLLRLRKYMNQILLDQLPNLSIMLRSLQQLSLMSLPTQYINKSFIVQQVPQLKSQIVYNKNWKQIAQYQLKTYFNQSQQMLKNDMKRMAELYTNETFQGLIDGFNCNNCKKQAFKRCSKCKSVWYCSKQCQIQDWKKGHKQKCKMMKQQANYNKKQIQQKAQQNIKEKQQLISQVD